MAAKYFEDLGMREEFTLPPVILTQELRDAHIALYGEDWSPDRAEEAKAQGIIPPPLVISLIGGLVGKADWLAIYFLAEYRAIFYRPLKVGDEISVEMIVSNKESDLRDRNFGLVWVKQEISVGGELACFREIKYAIYKRPQQDS